MSWLKKTFKRNTHNALFKGLAGFGRAMNRFYENRNHDTDSNGERVILKKLNTLQPQIIFDVGANVGDYSLLASGICKSAKIFSFEPVSSTFEMLKKKVSSNSNIHPVNAGLFSASVEREIKIYNSHTHSSIYELRGVNYSTHASEKIQLLNGDSFIQKNNLPKIDFIKLDVEGAEMDALNGLKNSLAEKKIRMVQFEYGYINITTKNLLADYHEFFSQFGFIVGKIYPKEVEFKKYHFKHEDFIGPNYVAIHQDDTELKKILE